MPTVLIVDDDATFRELMKRHLNRMGFDVLENDTGKGVLAQIAEKRPVACLVDIFMDEKEGIETIGEIALMAERPRIIAVSSNALYLDIAKSMGADATLIKPILPDALAECLRGLALLA